MTDILNKILAVKADEVSAAKKHRGLASLRSDVENDAGLRAGLSFRRQYADRRRDAPAFDQASQPKGRPCDIMRIIRNRG